MAGAAGPVHLAHPLAARVRLAREVAPHKGPQGGHRAGDDGEVDLDAGPEGDVDSGDWGGKVGR